MKKLIVFLLLVALVVCIAAPVMAQNNPIQKGAKALSGFVGNWSSAKYETYTATNYDIGGAFEYFLSDNGAIRIGIDLGQFDNGVGTKVSDSFFSIGYKYNFRQAEAATFPYLRAGYGFGNTKEDHNPPQFATGSSTSADTNGFNVALGLEHLIGNAALFGEVNYQPLTTKTDGNSVGITTFGVNLGLKFYF